MHVVEIVRRLLSGVNIHAKRLQAVVCAVAAITIARRLSVSAMGKAFWGVSTTKHSIKRFDRLLSNKLLFKDLTLLYQQLAHRILEPEQRTIVLIDWTHICGPFHALVAAVSFKGRAVTVLSEVRPEKQLGNTLVQRRFLERLKLVLPEGCRPVIVSDAGFHGDFFRTAVALGWDFVGRIRGTARIFHDDQCFTKESLYRRATAVPQDLTQCRMYANNPMSVRLVLVHKPHSRRRTKPSRSKDLIAYRKSARDPWLLATSLPVTTTPESVIAVYSCRMQIEETFRDMKSDRFGLGLGYIRSKSPKRIAVLLALAAIAMLVVMLVGFHAERSGEHRKLQANTSKRRVLSLFTVGVTMLARQFLTPLNQIIESFRAIVCLGSAHRPLRFCGDP